VTSLTLEQSMTRKLHKAKESLRQLRNFAAGMLIGSASITPVFAADLTMDDMRMPILLGSLALLIVGLLLKAKRKDSARPHESSTPTDFGEGIGRYRLQLGRGSGD
jgi:hypothetical protein